MSRRRDQQGFTLVELLMASSVMLVVLFATLTTFDGFVTVNARTTKLIVQVDAGRNAMSRLARDLRDATGSTATTAPGESVLVRAEPHDLVMRRIDPFSASTTGNVTGVQTVRWCLEAARGRLHRVAAAGVAPVPSGCPGTPAVGWRNAVVADEIVNGARPLFTYDNTTLGEITTVNTFLAVDDHPTKAPAEATLHSGVFLRNQNRRPFASFSFVTLAGRNVQLNAGASRDPEGGMLTYIWEDNDVALTQTGPSVTHIAAAAGPRTITLTVTDSDGLSATQTQTVVVKS